MEMAVISRDSEDRKFLEHLTRVYLGRKLLV